MTQPQQTFDIKTTKRRINATFSPQQSIPNKKRDHLVAFFL